MSDPAPEPRQPSITCPECHRTSFHPQDIATGYCGACHWWTSDPLLARCPPPSGTARRAAARRTGPSGHWV